ncbi:MAG: tripartite tricarboxylate transporter permease [Firmicutes bacterium]|nr:tripartite tricarboxylate transporter permease [Bacillota bacterium]
MSALGAALAPANLGLAFAGAVIGTLTGVLPGFGPAAAIAILIPATFSLPPANALVVLSGVYFGAMYGGSTASILLRLPGEAASVITVIDGHEMAKRGRAGQALAVAAIGSFVANAVGIIGLAVAAPALTRVAMAFGPPEYFALLLVGLLLSTGFFGRSPLKGLQMLLVGLLLGAVGLDPVSGYPRLTFGSTELLRGFDFVPIAMGLFGLADMLATVGSQAPPSPVTPRLRDLMPSREDLRRSVGPIARGTLLGFPLGVIPGLGPVVASFLSYAIERKVSKRPEEFGKGAIEGVAGPETANNAAAAGTFVPLLSLGVPSSAVSAVILGALVIFGLRPGPMLLRNNPDLFWTVVAGMFLANAILLVLNLPLVPLWASVLRLPRWIFTPLVLMSMVAGAYSINGATFDVVVMVISGILGYWLQSMGYPPVPLVIGLVLSPLLEQNFRQSLAISHGSLAIFWSTPLAAVLVALAVVLVLWRPLGASVAWVRRQARREATS